MAGLVHFFGRTIIVTPSHVPQQSHFIYARLQLRFICFGTLSKISAFDSRQIPATSTRGEAKGAEMLGCFQSLSCMSARDLFLKFRDPWGCVWVAQFDFTPPEGRGNFELCTLFLPHGLEEWVLNKSTFGCSRPPPPEG